MHACSRACFSSFWMLSYLIWRCWAARKIGWSFRTLWIRWWTFTISCHWQLAYCHCWLLINMMTRQVEHLMWFVYVFNIKIENCCLKQQSHRSELHANRFDSNINGSIGITLHRLTFHSYDWRCSYLDSFLFYFLSRSLSQSWVFSCTTSSLLIAWCLSVSTLACYQIVSSKSHHINSKAFNWRPFVPLFEGTHLLSSIITLIRTKLVMWMDQGNNRLKILYRVKSLSSSKALKLILNSPGTTFTTPSTTF